MRKIYFYCPSPETFPALSVTGKECGLDCAHCGGHYLEKMVPIDEFEPGPETKGCLISGGCNARGSVPLDFEKMRRLKEKGLVLNVHSGLLDEETARNLAGVAGFVSFEVIGDSKTVKEVYGIDKGPEDYRESLGLLKKYKLEFRPHVCIGLNAGGYSGEDRAFELVREFSDMVILLVLIPTRGTEFEDVKVDVEHVLKMVRLAREKFSTVYMGCMRPRIRVIEEELVSLDGVVKPSKWLRDVVDKQGIEVVEEGVCCACV